MLLLRLLLKKKKSMKRRSTANHANLPVKLERLVTDVVILEKTILHVIHVNKYFAKHVLENSRISVVPDSNLIPKNQGVPFA